MKFFKILLSTRFRDNLLRSTIFKNNTFRGNLLSITTLKITALISQLLLLNTVYANDLPITLALPTGATITSGTGNIHNTDTTLTVNQYSNKMSIDYSAFNIGKEATVRFIQPGADSIALNRVTGSNPSEILGQLSANGQIFLINPNGVIFGNGATVEVGGLLASTLQLSNEDFLAGNYNFSAQEQAEITQQGIINRGVINASEQGYLALISHHVINEGEINAPSGSVLLHSADKVMVTFNQQVVAIESTQATIDGLIENHGIITADGGYIVLNSNTVNTLQETVVNNTGIIRATSIIEKGGEVMIIGNGGDVFNQGIIDVSASKNSASDTRIDGGTISINAARIAQVGSLQADGYSQGDGGNIHLKATDELFATEHSTASVNGGEHGNGGDVIYFSDHNALLAEGASITARGGHLAGDGGFVEVSGLTWVGVKGFVDTRASFGTDGTFLIDPTDINIIAGSAVAGGSFGAGTWTSGADSASIGVDDIRTQLLTNNVIIDTATGDGGTYQGSGDINVNAALDLDARGGRTLTLQADRNININANICDGGASCQVIPDDSVGLIFNAANQLTIADGVEVNAGSAKIAITTGVGGAQVTGLVSSNFADDAINIITAGAITNSGNSLVDITNTSGGGATLNAVDGIDLDTHIGRLTLTNSATGSAVIDEVASLILVGVNVDTDLTLNTDANLTLLNDIDIEGANGATYNLNIGGNITFNDNVGITDSSGADDAVTMNFNSGGNFTIGATSANDIRSYGGNITINAGALFNKQVSFIDSGSGKVAITASDVILRGGIISTNASVDAIKVTSATNLVDNNDNGIDIQAVNGGAILTASGLLQLDTDTLLLSLTNAGGITDIDSANSTSITKLEFSGGAVNIDTLTGDLTVSNAVDTNGANGNTLTLNAANNLNINAHICDGGVSCVASPDDNVNLNANAGGDINLIDAAVFHVQDLSFIASSGTIMLPESGLTVSGNTILRAQDVIDTNGRTLDIVANDLVYQATAPLADTVINSQVTRIDAFQGGNNLSIAQMGDLTLADIDNDSIALENNNGNLQVTVNNGNLVVEDVITATDSSADGIRSGMVDLLVNNGLVNIGTSAGATIQSMNNLDEAANGGLGSEPTNQVAIRIQQLSNLDAAQEFTLGDGVGNDVIISATGGDIFLYALASENVNEANPILMVLNSDVSITSSGNTGGTDGLVTLEGVTNDNAAALIAGTNRQILLRGSLDNDMPIPPTPIPPTPIPPILIPIEDEVSLVNQTEVAPMVDDTQSDIDNQLTAQVRQSRNSFNSIFKACINSSENKAQKNNCHTENTVKSFLSSFLIGGNLPTMKKGI